MKSFKEFQELHENFSAPVCLGVSTPTTIAQLQSRWDEMGLMPRKKLKPAPEEEITGMGIGDEEIPDEEIPDEDMLAPEDEEGEDNCDDEEEVPEEDGEMTPPVEDEEDFLTRSKKVADGAQLMRKGVKMMHKGMKKTEACNACSKMMKGGSAKKPTKEQNEFMSTLQRQTGQTFFKVNPDGTLKSEDTVLPPIDQNANLQVKEPQPGEAGFAPQNKVGDLGFQRLDTFAEWAVKRSR